jgi:hypothetical protein
MSYISGQTNPRTSEATRNETFRRYQFKPLEPFLASLNGPCGADSGDHFQFERCALALDGLRYLSPTAGDGAVAAAAAATATASDTGEEERTLAEGSDDDSAFVEVNHHFNRKSVEIASVSCSFNSNLTGGVALI